MADESRRTRREFLVAAGTAGAGLLLTGCSSIAATEEEEVAPPEEFAKLADQFEDRERETLGPEGFEKAVVQVARIEEAMGIADLAQFTPKT